jgi:hypothetical protein
MTILKTMSLAALAFAAVAVRAQTDQQDIRVVIDGQPLQFADQQATEIDGRILVPLRGIFEKLGATVDWDRSTQTIRASKNGLRIKLLIGQLDASVNGGSVRMDVAATLVGGTTMVPLRFVSEALGGYVNWDQTNHEVDITSSTEYNLRRRNGDTSQPPPLSGTRPLRQSRVEGSRPSYSVIAVDTVIPFTLNTRLSSFDAHIGDGFSARLATNGENRYLGLPRGTEVYGSVTFAQRQRDRRPGVLELTFDHLVMPDGQSLAVEGRLIGLDAHSVTRKINGATMAKDTPRTGRVVFAGYGPGSGLIVGIHTRDQLEEGTISDLLYGATNSRQREQQVRDVELRPGTDIGLRLYQELKVPRG